MTEKLIGNRCQLALTDGSESGSQDKRGEKGKFEVVFGGISSRSIDKKF